MVLDSTSILCFTLSMQRQVATAIYYYFFCVVFPVDGWVDSWINSRLEEVWETDEQHDKNSLVRISQQSATTKNFPKGLLSGPRMGKDRRPDQILKGLELRKDRT